MSIELLKDRGLWRQAAFIDGHWMEESPHGKYALRNPATGEVLVELPVCREPETEFAVKAAHAAFQRWSRVPAKQRGEIVNRWYQLVVEHKEDLATLITLEEGKPLAEARGEVDYAASFLQWFSEEAKRVRGDVIPAHKESQRIVALKQPIGVCAAITPWNFPAAMITRKAGPALAAGCSMVVKPASQTPLTALALAELAHRAGVPAGVFSVVTGNATRPVGNMLTGHPLVRKITFTGSTEVGRLLLAQSAETIKKCSMELGGNAPLIVFDDADLDLAVEGILNAKFRNTGQSCIAANRVLIQDGVYERLADRLAARTAELKVGNGLEEGVQIGPMIDTQAVAKVEEHLANAVAGGARVLVGGRRHALGGAFFEPTVVAGVDLGMTIAQEETFGPVMPLLRFSTEAQAIAMANDTDFGLAAYLFSRDAARIWRTAEALESGMVGINTGLISNEVAPFGGVKQSGLGREGSHYGIEEFLELKYLCWDGLIGMP
ncbi:MULTISPECIES: NAD-dependent succinate-semialdehyde dehydrogenase [unclassified Pseudomonas]|uniref:NAD-dependent succinate-semialdehyde dehydrogenase n=1 Tax=unclassified Pseudomonas TaxID=196821 RepID=UPI0002A3DB8F|nr:MULTISPECIES: NAD-dependent succinate-semialdehyde dehydrogenase [unclassified Pseudomonas]MBB1606070.1 succinate-semialdehyde dehydrogenase (NADP(+)) [Pseudomonas sp. UMC76]MBB1636543.1 succinate-semialdehyde dehydrogenase (NADP(+)) [Pseudomonas sp. UME83]NTX92715.1 NAD-dependent succinate-semialdehyde dehydrogenase [Pseudomonas sp. UMA643]NTY19925.1 NAD-dependent succinate-semialdehyde dehydrogenase [Pseudomonas sp. UMC3103]NTY27334.1 NAD-dependent succinate-semialdehyde dehydrogenase [Ps